MRKITKKDRVVISLLNLKKNYSSYPGELFRETYSYEEYKNDIEIIYKNEKNKSYSTVFYRLPCGK